MERQSEVQTQIHRAKGMNKIPERLLDSKHGPLKPKAGKTLDSPNEEIHSILWEEDLLEPKEGRNSTNSPRKS